MDITTNKLNRVKALAAIGRYTQTFDTLIREADRYMDLSRMTARQIADVIDFGYQQHQSGRLNPME